MKSLFEVYEPQGAYNGARYISLSVSDEKTILRKAIEREINEQEKGGIICFSTDVNAKQLNDISFFKAIHQFLTTKSQGLIGWNIGGFMHGKYSREGKVWNEESIAAEIIGITSEKLLEYAKDLCSEFNQESVIINDYNSHKILFINRA